MIEAIIGLLTHERPLRLAWTLDRAGRRSLLVGTAHFFPYRFRAALRALLAPARVVLLEGPFDDEARRRVEAAGQRRRGASLYDALSPAARRRIAPLLQTPRREAAAGYALLQHLHDAAATDELRSLQPWLAFFRVWSRLRQRDRWTYSMDVDVARLARTLGKPLRCLETIDEQIAALEAVPLARYAAFLERDEWAAYRQEYRRHYLAGELAELMVCARRFPTCCPAVIEARDAELAERLLPDLAEGGALACIGVMHSPGVLAALRDAGYAVRPVTG